MTLEQWIHIAELVVVALLIPGLKSVGTTVIGLRDATRDLAATTTNIGKQLEDHEKRIRWVEQNGTYDGPERRHREPRASDRS